MCGKRSASRAEHSAAAVEIADCKEIMFFFCVCARATVCASFASLLECLCGSTLAGHGETRL